MFQIKCVNKIYILRQVLICFTTSRFQALKYGMEAFFRVVQTPDMYILIFHSTLYI
jgi:hypothetical protein